MRLIDADAVIRCECGQCDGHCNTFDGEECLKCTSHNKCQLREAIENAPTVDAVEVVRCKECEEADKTCVWSEGILFCNMWQTITFNDGYCHHGRRVTNAAD